MSTVLAYLELEGEGINEHSHSNINDQINETLFRKDSTPWNHGNFITRN